MYPIQCRGCGKEGIPRGEVAMFKTSTNCMHISPGGQPKQLNRIRLLLSEIYLKAKEEVLPYSYEALHLHQYVLFLLLIYFIFIMHLSLQN